MSVNRFLGFPLIANVYKDIFRCVIWWFCISDEKYEDLVPYVPGVPQKSLPFFNQFISGP